MLAEGSFSRDDLEVEFRDEMLPLTPSLEAEISAHWISALSRAQEQGIRLHDGALFNLEDACCDTGRLHLSLSRTRYRRWTYSAGRKEAAWISRPLACCAALISSDGKLLLQERSAEVAEGPGLLHVPGGHPDPERDLRGGRPDLFVAMEAELHEELGLLASDLGEGRILGLVENLENGKPELLFRYETGLGSEEIAARAEDGRDAYEFATLRFLSADSESLALYLADKKKRLAVPSQALLSKL